MSGADPMELTAMLAFAQELADAARPIAMRYFRQPVLVETKADHSPVTIADRAIESEMRRMISERFPGHGVFGEEFAEQIGRDYTWVLDPIDGTRSFITGMPLFGTLIALMQAPIRCSGSSTSRRCASAGSAVPVKQRYATDSRPAPAPVARWSRPGATAPRLTCSTGPTGNDSMR